MITVGIVGHFGKGKICLDGQTVKTINLANLLREKEDINLSEIDTDNWKKHPIKLILQTLKMCKKCQSVIMLPAHNGVKVFSSLLLFFKRKTTKLYYSVVGGWLPELVAANKKLLKNLKKFDGIWVETKNMQLSLQKYGLENVSIIPNFKNIEPLKETELSFEHKYPLRLCTFSRVHKQKGIEDAIQAVEEINREKGEIIYTLDIYGQIDNAYKDEFETLQKTFPDFIAYKGMVDADKSVQVLKDYFALLFPTRYYTEGLPGTILDAYASGVSVISARWQNFDDLIVEGKTGIGFDFEDYSVFKKVLKKVAENPEIIDPLKYNCLKEFEKYTKENISRLITSELFKEN